MTPFFVLERVGGMIQLQRKGERELDASQISKQTKSWRVKSVCKSTDTLDHVTLLEV